MEPVTLAAIIGAGASVLDTVVGAFDDTAEKEGQKNRDAQLKIAADNLGLNYAQLKQQADQFYSSQKNELKKWADQKGISLQQLAEQIRSNKAGEAAQAGQLALGRESLASSKQQFAISQASNPNVVREKRLNELRKAFLTPKIPKAVTPPTPTSKTVAPTATPTKSLGAEALKTSIAAPSTTSTQGVA